MALQYQLDAIQEMTPTERYQSPEGMVVFLAHVGVIGNQRDRIINDGFEEWVDRGEVTLSEIQKVRKILKLDF